MGKLHKRKSPHRKKGKPDFPLLIICLLLIFSGILILASVSASFSLQKTGSTFTYLNHQILFAFIPGTILGSILFFTPLEVIKRWSFHAFAGTLLLLLAVFLPGIGGELGGAQRWLFLGPFSFQPSELLKLTSVVYLATLLGNRIQAKRSAQGSVSSILLPFLGVAALVSFILLLQPDMSTLVIIALTAGVLFFLAETPLWHTLLMGSVGLAGGVLLALLSPYRLSRLQVLLDPSLDPLGKGYHIKQALIGIGSGGLAGLGLSFQKFGFLPEPMSDSVFAVFAEEMGFIGSLFLISLFLAFAWRGFLVARKVPDIFSRLTAFGIIFWIVFQAFVNIGALTGILPLTGIPLPFISYGGSALLAQLLAIGILLNISQYQQKPA